MPNRYLACNLQKQIPPDEAYNQVRIFKASKLKLNNTTLIRVTWKRRIVHEQLDWEGLLAERGKITDGDHVLHPDMICSWFTEKYLNSYFPLLLQLY